MKRNLLILVAVATVGCLGNAAFSQDDRAGFEFFEAKIRPVLVKHCYECHSKDSGKARGGLRVDTRDALLRGGDTGPAVVPKSLDKSLLLQAILYEQLNYQMPPKGKLSAETIADFRRWILMGAPDPRVTKSAPDVKTTIDLAAGRKFWSYQLPTKSEPPHFANNDWPQTNIDRFVYGKLNSQSLTPNSDASARTLVRRLFFVLTGLPPTPQAADHWVSRIGGDSGVELNQDEIAKLVDGLLGTKYYGEHWGRHWMDVARFAESTGGDSNNVYQHAWRYRDYVIDSFNDDKPYDQFVREQLAGDLLPIADDEEWANNVIATGFLAVGMKLVGEEDQQQFFADLVDEQIDTTTRAFLGTTVACARCHDHKFDPIPQVDYYAIAGIFRSSQTHYGLLKAQARQATTLLDLTGMGPPPGRSTLNKDEYAALIQKRDDARKTVEDAMKKIRAGENVFRGTLRRIRSDRDETEAALQSFDNKGNPRVFAMGTQDRDFPLTTHLLVRGELDQPAQVVPRGMLQVLSPPGKHLLPARLQGSGRLQLADWIASDQNPLTARVMANRIWHWMTGQGLVRTVDEFGSTGERPSHPKLLDYLAIRLIENKWSVKDLVREIALSRTWQLSSDFDEAKFAIDPDNRLHWRANKRRLEAEAVRDSILAASGRLDAKRPLGTLLAEVGEGNVGQNVFEPVIRAIESNHRSVYLPRVRGVLPEMLELYDAPDASLVTGIRDTTASPLQSLYMLNNAFVQTHADALAMRLAKSPADERINDAYLLTLGRLPTETEKGLAMAFINQIDETSSLDRHEKLAAYCQALFCTAEFSSID